MVIGVIFYPVLSYIRRCYIFTVIEAPEGCPSPT